MKYIKDYEGLYSITEDGQVYSHKSNKFMKQSLSSDGYPKICITKKDGSRSTVLVHRLVALTYIDNPLNLPQVNHKDEVKDNNHVSNLEWCDNQYNSEYSNAKVYIAL